MFLLKSMGVTSAQVESMIHEEVFDALDKISPSEIMDVARFVLSDPEACMNMKKALWCLRLFTILSGDLESAELFWQTYRRFCVIASAAKFVDRSNQN